MRQPPEPQYSFTIPSIHDDLALSCRIYHPDALNEQSSASYGGDQWRRRGITMAHPYAPMGGSYDDRIVSIVVDEFLKAGWIVGTFNFRGAQGSKGRTSWSGRPELDDYTSFAAFFVHYLSHLLPHPAPDTPFSPDQSPCSTQAQPPPQLGGEADSQPVMVLGGYSYGSLVLKHLPPVPTILQSFSSPISGSASDEIIMRAHKLADQSNLGWINRTRSMERERASQRSHEAKTLLTMGGEETSPEKRRRSREVRRSVEGSLGADLGSRLRSLSHRGRKGGSSTTSLEKKESILPDMPAIRYLLISPLAPPISTLAAPVLGHKFWNKAKDSSQEVLGKHPTLAVYGNEDIFSSAKRTRDWGEQLQAIPGSQFSIVEVAHAGHFWVENGVEEELRSSLTRWEGKIR